MRNTFPVTRVAVAAALALSAAACSEQATPLTTGPELALAVGDNNILCTDLLAGQTLAAGTVCASVDDAADELLIKYQTANGWELTEVHLWVGQTAEGYPQTKTGNPKVGNFPYPSGDITGQTSYTVRVPLSAFGIYDDLQNCADYLLYAMAHAALRKDLGGGIYQTETGWGNGSPVVSKGSWATRFSFTVKKTGCDGDVEPKTETAFAYGGTKTSGVGGIPVDGVASCFLGINQNGIWVGDFKNPPPGLDGDFDRWGWTNGPIAENPTPYSWPLYAAAGQCDLSKGTRVGTVAVTYQNGTATVTYTTTAPYFLTETHLYVGSAILPSDNGAYTVAPGQYGNVNEYKFPYPTTKTYTISGLTGSVYVVAHATVGGF